MRPTIPSLLALLESHYDADRTWSLLENIWAHECWFDAPRQAQALHVVAHALRAANVTDVVVEAMPADGRTCFQDWMAPLAWDCEDAKLSLMNGMVLGDRRVNPCTTVLSSGPLAPTTAPVIDGDALTSFEAADVDQKWILTAGTPRAMKQKLLGRSPVGIISDYLARGYGFSDGDVKWHNDWGDGPEGWFFHADDQQMAGFSVSPAMGRILRASMAAGPTQLHGHCDSRLYDGAFHNLTASIPGTDPSQEVWLIAHCAEQGAHDNCSGQAVIASALIQLRALIDAGVLPPPMRTIRIVMMPECIGITSFVTAHEEFRRKAVMAFYIDGVGDQRGGDRRYDLSFGPASNPSFGWALAGMLAGNVERAHEAFGVDPTWHVNSADDMIADPLCGIPTQWLGASGASSTGYHSSGDTPAICSATSLRGSTILATAWAYLAATLDDASVATMLPEACDWIDRHVVSGEGDTRHLRTWAAGQMLRSLRRLGIGADVIESTAARYGPAAAPPLPDLPVEGPRYRRHVWGTVTLETLPPERRRFSRWAASNIAGLYWTDGTHPLSAVARLAAAETGKRAPNEAFFQALVDAGLASVDPNRG